MVEEEVEEEVEEAGVVAEAVEEEEGEEELRNHNNPSRSPRMSGLWGLHPPFTMEIELKLTTGLRN